MTAPGWLDAALAVVMLAIAACCAARLVIWLRHGRGAEPEADALHVLMGLAMAGMLVPTLNLVPVTAWIAMFAAGTCWFAWQAVRSGVRRQRRAWQCAHPVPHAVESAAMIYMLWPAQIPGHGPAMAMRGMAGHAGPNPAIAIVLALFMLGYVLWTTDQLTTRSLTGPSGTVTACYKIVMGATMGYMLLTMI
jgi:hypothetical protein